MLIEKNPRFSPKKETSPVNTGILKNLNLNHLYYFHIAAQSGSLTEAAKKLTITQPTLSQQINKLESSLETNLFHREGRSLKLNAKGRYLFGFTQRIFELTEQMMLNLSYYKNPSKKTEIAIGLASTLPSPLTSQILFPLFNSKDLLFKTVENDFPLLTSQLEEGNLDFIIAENHNQQKSSGSLEVRGLLQPAYLAVAGPEFDIAKLEGDFPQCLTGQPYFKYSSRNPVQRKIDQYFLQNNVAPEVTGQSDDLDTTCLFTLNNACFSVIPAPVRGRYDRLNTLGLIEIESAEICAFFQRERSSQLTPIVQLLESPFAY